MNFSFSSLMCGLVFGTAGIWLIRHGKKQSNIIAAIIGLAMMIYPYFISSEWLNWTIGLALTAAAYLTW